VLELIEDDLLDGQDIPEELLPYVDLPEWADRARSYTEAQLRAADPGLADVFARVRAKVEEARRADDDCLRRASERIARVRREVTEGWAAAITRKPACPDDWRALMSARGLGRGRATAIRRMAGHLLARRRAVRGAPAAGVMGSSGQQPAAGVGRG
jgi:hypothetical protein